MDRGFCVGFGPAMPGLGSAAPRPAAGGARCKIVGDFTYCLEGAIYSSGPERLEKFIAEALRADSAPRCAAMVKDFVSQEDGEFVVAAAQHGTGRSLLFNDVLGRLPLFMAKASGGSGLVVGRSLSAVIALRGGPLRSDRLGIASRLLFGYPLDSRTEHEGIESVPESSLVWVGSAGEMPTLIAGEVQFGGAPENVGARCRSGGEGDLLEALGNGPVRACERRINRLRGWMPTLALSGGFDSRLVACALKRTGADVETITRTDYLSDRADATTAEQVAAALDFRHHAIPCGAIGMDLIRRLSGIGEGGLAIDVGHMLGFLEKARERIGPARFLLTGDGGDKTAAPLLPLGRMTQSGEVARMMSALSSRELEACRVLTGLSAAEIRDYIDQSLRSQPGRTVPEKVRALAFRQRGRRWLNLGEDRNRTVFWSTTPFYAPEYFFRANAIPDALKQRDRLYLRLLGWFDKRLARISRPGRGRHRFADRLLLEGHLQLGRSPLLTGLYRRMRPRKPIPAFRLFIADDLCAARLRGGGIWEICDEQTFDRLFSNPPSETFRSQLLALALWRGSDLAGPIS